MHDEDGWFDADAAAHYDDPTDEHFAEAVIGRTVDRLAELAGDGRALELAIGTGRIGLPLVARGVPVDGIELSRAMLTELRAKPGGATIPVTVGDMASVDAPAGSGSYRLVYLVFNTIMNLTTQAAQVACFRNAARHLEPGGRFVVEVGVPALRQLPPGARFVVFDHGETHRGVDEYAPATQGLVSHHLELRDGRWEASSVPFRYVWPAELDLMAELAGLRLQDRWAGWDREPFTDDSVEHVSVWQRPAEPSVR